MPSPPEQRQRRWLPPLLLAVFAVYWLALAIAPLDRHDWALENVLTVVSVVLLVATYQVLPLSSLSYVLIFLFLCLHALGAHYTYMRVPYDAWFAAVFGSSLNEVLGWERNNFDRIVHFGYGLLLAYPIRELFFRVANARGFWGYFLPLDLTMSTSMMFELLEWAVAVLVGGDLGIEYLGTQGDEWDAHKDMALASLGALIAMAVVVAVNLRLQRDFAREWAESLRIKHREPLGETRIARYLRGWRRGSR